MDKKEVKSLLDIPLSQVLLTRVSVGDIHKCITQLVNLKNTLKQGNTLYAHAICSYLILYCDNLVERELHFEEYLKQESEVNHGKKETE